MKTVVLVVAPHSWQGLPSSLSADLATQVAVVLPCLLDGQQYLHVYRLVLGTVLALPSPSQKTSNFAANSVWSFLSRLVATSSCRPAHSRGSTAQQKPKRTHLQTSKRRWHICLVQLQLSYKLMTVHTTLSNRRPISTEKQARTNNDG